MTPDNVSVTYTQLGAAGGLRMLGTTRGLLPNGPNGIPAFNTLDAISASFFSPMLHPTYNYTLELQGTSNNVSCAYDISSPVNIAPATPDLWQFDGTCPPGQDIFNITAFTSQESNNYLGFWACLADPSSSSSKLYLRGTGLNYRGEIGNITCTVSPIQPTLFKLTYTGQPGTFSTQAPIPSSQNLPTVDLRMLMVKSLGSVVWEAQSQVSNLVAESVFTFGAKSFGLPPLVQNAGYLALYEKMIEGIFDYQVRPVLLPIFFANIFGQATYIRLLYSTHVDDSTPSSCMRTVNGSADLQVFGWSANSQTGVYLLPITIINLTTLVILVIAMCTDDKGTKLLPRFDPTDPESLILSHDESGRLLRAVTVEPNGHAAWSSIVAFGRNKAGIYRLWPREKVSFLYRRLNEF